MNMLAHGAWHKWIFSTTLMPVVVSNFGMLVSSIEEDFMGRVPFWYPLINFRRRNTSLQPKRAHNFQQKS